MRQTALFEINNLYLDMDHLDLEATVAASFIDLKCYKDNVEIKENSNAFTYGSIGKINWNLSPASPDCDQERKLYIIRLVIVVVTASLQILSFSSLILDFDFGFGLSIDCYPVCM